MQQHDDRLHERYHIESDKRLDRVKQPNRHNLETVHLGDDPFREILLDFRRLCSALELGLNELFEIRRKGNLHDDFWGTYGW